MAVILLAGGGEFGGQMAVADRIAMDLAGGPDAPVRIIPTAAAPDNNHRRAGANGVGWFKRLGAANVFALPLIDDASADDPAIAGALERAGLIYLLGGFPGHLAQSLRGSRSWQAIVAAYQAGAVIAGSSAGAMVLCDYFYDPGASRVMPGLALIEGLCILPHHNTFGQSWAAKLTKLLPNSILLGIDEESAAVCRVSEGRGSVHGKGRLTLYHNDRIEVIAREQVFDLARLNI